MTVPIKETGLVIPVGRLLDLQPTLLKDGAAIDLTGKTVTCTFRREDRASTAITGFTNLAVTLGNDDTLATAGGVRLAVEVTSAFAVPQRPGDVYYYLAEFYVAELDYSPQKARFGVTMSFRA